MIREITEYEYFMEVEDLLYNQNQKAVLMFVADGDQAVTQELLRRLKEVEKDIQVPVYVLEVMEADTVSEQFHEDKDKDIPDILIFNLDKDKPGDYSDRFAWPGTSIDTMVEIVLSLRKGGII